ncbi:MAG: hypothetical protein COB62_07805 [Piscirickettsiaceae bacterium]|nr:MAG: hypothetical protein COB62_07805 [Piscirickettsiaceae bacterium]
MIKNTGKLLLAGTAALLLAACSEATHTTEWYIQNTGDQAVNLTDCNAKPELRKSQNCINVYEAELVIGKGHDAIQKYLTDHNLKGHSIGQ